MKPVCALSLILLAACSPKSEPSAAEEMRGKIHYSFEKSEFRYRGDTYFVSDKYGLVAAEIDRLRQAGGSYEITADMCLVGHIVSKAQNQNRGFGHAGQYAQAVEVEKICPSPQRP